MLEQPLLMSSALKTDGHPTWGGDSWDQRYIVLDGGPHPPRRQITLDTCFQAEVDVQMFGRARERAALWSNIAVQRTALVSLHGTACGQPLEISYGY